MSYAMVTGRMSSGKKERANRILRREGLGASQAINLLYDRIIEEGSAEFITGVRRGFDPERWKEAAGFVDALPQERATRFDEMASGQVRCDRLAARGLM